MQNTKGTTFSFGKSRGLIILVGAKLGYEISYHEQAVSLSNGKEIEPALMGMVDKEATHIQNMITNDNRIDEANRSLEIVLSELSGTENEVLS